MRQELRNEQFVFCFFLFFAKWHHWLMYLFSTLCSSCLPLDCCILQIDWGWKKKKNSHRTSFTGRCVKATEKNIFVWPTFIMRKKIIPEKKIPELTYFSSDASDCTYQWETAEWTCKILFRKKKTGWLKYFECKIIVPFWCFEAFLVHLKERGKKGNIHSITYLPLLPSFERRNWTVLKPKSLTCF